MAKKNKTNDKFRIISKQHLSQVTNIDYMYIYNHLNGIYRGEMDPNKKTELINALHNELEPLFQFLGCEMKLKRTTKP